MEQSLDLAHFLRAVLRASRVRYRYKSDSGRQQIGMSVWGEYQLALCVSTLRKESSVVDCIRDEPTNLWVHPPGCAQKNPLIRRDRGLALETVGEIRRVGVYGNGYVAKLVNNQLWLVHAAAIGEAMVAAKKAGLEPATWWAAMKGGAAESFVMQHDVPSIFAGHYDPSFRLELCLKDLGLIAQLLAETGTRHELTQATHARFTEAQNRYGKSAGEMTVCKVIEDDAGIDLRVSGDWTPPWEVKHPTEAAV